MIANLPLLFANGNPTTLSRITTSELERFISFMVTCSWGHDTAKDIRQPPWWPSDVPFTHPFSKPSKAPYDWSMRLKKLVRKCYDYHKSAFLLIFSTQLARYPSELLTYVDNRDHTTSLYYAPKGRLLVTFRNENMFYDRKQITNSRPDPQMRPADIYLCDNCDSHFDNIDVLRSHERLCNNEEVPVGMCNGGLPEFLSALKLTPLSDATEKAPVQIVEARSRQIRSTVNTDRGTLYPFSSLAYIKNIKSNIQRDTSHSRERIERYCCSIPLAASKIMLSRTRNNNFPVKYRRPIDYWHRNHVFPHQRRKQILDIKGQLLLLKCRPVKVNIQRMSPESIQNYIDQLNTESIKKSISKDIEFVDEISSDNESVELPPKLEDPLVRTEYKHREVVTTVCNEVIDLCSDDEGPSTNENQDPRAGITCVMRGGAVLRRTPVTPTTLPNDPCGARQRPLQPAILQQPVILFTQSLHNLQTISLD